MIITDETRRVVAIYLTDYLLAEKEQLMIPESKWTREDIINWIDSGLEAYESIHQLRQYAVSISPDNFNGQMFLLSDAKKVKLFNSITEAKGYAQSLAPSIIYDVCEYLPDSKDYVVI